MHGDRELVHMPNHVLAALSAADLSLLQPNLKFIDLRLGTVLQEPDTKVEHAYFPCTGMISLLAVMANGQSVETATVGCEGAVNTVHFLNDKRAFNRAVVQADGAALMISSPLLKAAMKDSMSLPGESGEKIMRRRGLQGTRRPMPRLCA